MTRHTRCRECDAPILDRDRFCEACGMSLRPVPRWASSTTPGGACSSCGNTRIDADGFCENCGHRKAAGLDRVELELDGVVAITDRGPRRRRNEDAVGIGQVGDYLAIIVCDGVASTARADVAAHAAVDAGIVAILRALAEGESADCAVRASFGAALAAVALLGESSGDTAPSCTFVSAVVAAGDSAESGASGESAVEELAKGSTVTLCWAGDSRAYWLPHGVEDPVCRTVDDSLAGQLAEAGIEVGEELGSRGAALVRWLGADAGDVEPHVTNFQPSYSGRLVLCSDGLSRYLPGAVGTSTLATMVFAAESPGEAARGLTRFALDSGGQDNVTVVVVDVPGGG